MHRDRRVDLRPIKRVAFLTIEGEHDDISGVGQTEAAHGLCVNIPAERKAHWLQPGVGHYGVFNGSRFRSEIAPRIADFALSMGHGTRAKRNSGAAAHKAGNSKAQNGTTPLPGDRAAAAATAGFASAKSEHRRH